MYYKEFLDKLRLVAKWIKEHKYIFVTLVFLAIILVIDENSMISHVRNKTKISNLSDEIEVMEADSANIQSKLQLYTNEDISVIEDVARERGMLKENEEVFVIE